MTTEILARIEAPHFSAGIVFWDDATIETAPIVSYMKRDKWTRQRVVGYCAAKGWKYEQIWRHERKDIDAKGRAMEEIRR